MDDYRADPDALLAAIQKTEAREGRGKLKIFFGMAAGVGKTYAMLQAAHDLKAEGVDVVVGYVETHKRAETGALIENLEVIPRQKVEYRGTWLEEMDTDAILTRRPQCVLVDELAHTNVPGVRHLKRYQDVQELLDAGINVLTTINVQHFESRADAVRQITGITVHETVPDSVLDMADEIELIDLSPEDLRKRLAEGKVYTPERVETAAQNFFRIGNLTALREMALRLTAERVDHQLQDYMQVKKIAGPWKSGERLMVAVSSSPFSERLIRWTRRMAYNLEAPWLAVYIETPEALPAEDKERLADHLALARKLGGEVIVTAGTSISDGLIRLAHQRNVTQIVVGKPLHGRLQSLLRGGSLVDQVIRASGDIDIYVVTGDKPEATPPPAQLPAPVQHSGWPQYIIALMIVVIATAVNLALLPMIGYYAAGLIELFAVLIIAVYVGRGPAIVAAVLSGLSWDFLFIEPRFTFTISRAEDVILFVLYFAIAIFAGNLTARLRTQERQARNNADRTMALYTLAHDIAAAVDMDDVLRITITQIGRVFDADVVMLAPDLNKQTASIHPASTLILDQKEQSVALWAYENGKPAGRFTDTLPLSSVHFLPLNTVTRTVGVIGLRYRQRERLDFDKGALLETFISQIALVVERELLDQAAEQSAMMQESERLYTTLLNSISHELRNPIKAITEAAHHLRDSHTAAHAPEPARDHQRALAGEIESAAERLNRLVENLLDMSRLESGRLQLKREACDVSQVMAAAVQRLQPESHGRLVSVEIAPDLPPLMADSALIEQAIVNLLDNACHYTPADAPIAISARRQGQYLLISVRDYGAGIPAADLERIFDKFYRGEGVPKGGTGLGLSITRGLIEAHGGHISVSNAVGGGAEFVIQLPL